MKILAKSIIITISCYFVFMLGYNHSEYEIHTKNLKCSEEINNSNIEINDFYNHRILRDNAHTHAIAMHYSAWAKCFREGMFRD